MPRIKGYRKYSSSASQRALRGEPYTLRGPRLSARLKASASLPAVPSPSAVLIHGPGPDRKGFTDLPGELRNQIYDLALSGTHITFSFLGWTMHAVYPNAADDSNEWGPYLETKLPKWLLASKAVLREGLSHLQAHGAMVLEFEEMYSPYCLLLDPASFRSFTIHCESASQAFDPITLFDDNEDAFLELHGINKNALMALSKYLRTASNRHRNHIQNFHFKLRGVDDAYKATPLDPRMLDLLIDTLPNLQSVKVELQDEEEILWSIALNLGFSVSPDKWFDPLEDWAKRMFASGQSSVQVDKSYKEVSGLRTDTLLVTKE